MFCDNENKWNVEKMKGKTIVVKYGGSSMESLESITRLIKQVVELDHLGIKVILVHGGGKDISSMMKRLDLKPQFINGLRVTDIETLEAVKMVLIGKINKELVSLITNLGGTAVGLSGIDGRLLLCEKKYIEVYEDGEKKQVDGGFIGEVVKVNEDLLGMLLSNGIIPVVAPVGIGNDGENYNINGDDAASAIAQSMNAHTFVLVSDTDGIYKNPGDKDTRIEYIKINESEEMIKSGIIKGGMIPKLKCCTGAVKNGVKSVIIMNNMLEDGIIKNILCRSFSGTRIGA